MNFFFSLVCPHIVNKIHLSFLWIHHHIPFIVHGWKCTKKILRFAFASFWLLLLDNVTFFVLFLTKIHFFELSFQGIQDLTSRFGFLGSSQTRWLSHIIEKSEIRHVQGVLQMRFLDKMHEKSQSVILGVFEVCLRNYSNLTKLRIRSVFLLKDDVFLEIFEKG
jgi:hypothetical protein